MRQVNPALFGVIDDAGDPTMQLSELLRERQIDDTSRKQRMREGDPTQFHAEQARRDGLVHPKRWVCARSCCHRRNRGPGNQGGREKRLPSARLHGLQSLFHQTSNAGRQRQWLAGQRPNSSGRNEPGDLERVKRIAAGHLMDPDGIWQRRRQVFPGKQQLSRGARRQRFQPDGMHAVGGQNPEQLKRRHVRRIIAPACQQHARPCSAKSRTHKRQRTSAFCVEPLQVIDSDYRDLLRGDSRDGPSRRREDSPAIDRPVLLFFAKEQHPESARERRRQQGERPVRYWI
jgi:hypothetical protein